MRSTRGSPGAVIYASSCGAVPTMDIREYCSDVRVACGSMEAVVRHWHTYPQIPLNDHQLRAGSWYSWYRPDIPTIFCRVANVIDLTKLPCQTHLGFPYMRGCVKRAKGHTRQGVCRRLRAIEARRYRGRSCYREHSNVCYKRTSIALHVSVVSRSVRLNFALLQREAGSRSC